MKKTILIGGEAGIGTNFTSVLLAKLLAHFGIYSFTYRDYPSAIKGVHNFNITTFSDRPIHSHEWKFDVILALDKKTIQQHKKDLKPGGFILTRVKENRRNIVSIDTETILQKLKLESVFGNNILVGVLMKKWGLELKLGLEAIIQEFPRQTKAIKETIRAGYKISVEPIEKLPVSKEVLSLSSGSKGVSEGAVKSGLDTYFAYPMTPATGVLHELARRQKSGNFLVAQLDDEISVMNAALGASYAGAMAMVGSAGGGVALMGEAISLAGMAEIPLVLYLAQRTSPGTGVPTYSSQGDLKFALNIGHGEFPRLVIAPGDAEEAYRRTIEAFYLSYKYRILSIIISDKHLAESYCVFKKIRSGRVNPKRFILEHPPKNYKSYQFTRSGISPRAVPGQGAVVRIAGYEHDEFGYTTEEAETVKKMNDKRFRKKEGLAREVSRLEPVSLYGKGKKLIIGWGSTKGAILDSLASLPGYRFLQISYLNPFPSEEVRAEIRRSAEVILIEANVTGLLGDVIAENTGEQITKKILKYDARPFTANDVIQSLKKI
jgi:2-oxoglutarate ferredoxin oxidoreductase subunit alpha